MRLIFRGFFGHPVFGVESAGGKVGLEMGSGAVAGLV